MNILAIDYGLVNLGLAISFNGLITSYLPIKVKKDNQAKVLEKLKEICQQEEIEQIVIGLPSGKLALAVKEFAYQLAEITKLKVILHDEALTSKLAVKTMIKLKVKKKKRKTKEHSTAACLILKDYLTSKKEK